jgi:hypothetical protein
MAATSKHSQKQGPQQPDHQGYMPPRLLHAAAMNTVLLFSSQ